MDPDGSNARLLAKSPDILNHGNPRMSHDGKCIAFSGADQTLAAGQCSVYVIASNGDLKTLKKLGLGRGPKWSPDDSKFAFFLRERDGEPGVYVMDADGTDRVRLCEGVYPAWSPDGSKIAMASQHEGGWSIYLVQLSGMHRLLSENYAYIAGGPEWSPDGTQLAFIGNRNAIWELGIVSAKGAKDSFRIRFTIRDRGDIGWLPAWSPDGKRLVFWIKDENNADRLHVINPYTEDAPVLLKGQEGTFFNSDPGWSTDGTKILFASDRQ